MFADKKENTLNQHFKQHVEIHPHNLSVWMTNRYPLKFSRSHFLPLIKPYSFYRDIPAMRYFLHILYNKRQVLHIFFLQGPRKTSNFYHLASVPLISVKVLGREPYISNFFYKV